MFVSSRSRLMLHMAGVLALVFSGASIAEGTQFVRNARASTIVQPPIADKLPKELSVDAMSQMEIDQVKRDLLSHLQRNPPGRADGIDGCMQWVFMRHGATESWMPVGYALPWLRLGALKINGVLREASVVYVIEPESIVRSASQGAVSVPGRRPGGGGITVTSFADRSSVGQLIAESKNDGQYAQRMFAGEVPATLRYLHVAPASNLRVSAARARCTLLAAECRRYVSDVDDDAQWRRPGGAAGNATPAAMTEHRIPFAAGLKTQIAIEDMCPFSRLGMVEAAINTRAFPVQRGITDHGIPGNASLSDALSKQ